MSSKPQDIQTYWGAFADRLSPALFEEPSIIEAPAKLNLRLKVLGRRADGYHFLSMLNASLSLRDVITVSLRRELGCEVSVQSERFVDIASKDNLVTKAFTEFWRVMGCEQSPVGLVARVAKLIPIGAGLGGGSSDAGAVLRYLEQSFREPLERFLNLSPGEFNERMMRAATKVGADVPYAFSGGVSWVTGIGEVVKQLGARRLWVGKVLVAVPAEPVPTIPFYDFFRKQHPVLPDFRDDALEQAVHQGFEELPLELLENDFESDIVCMVPAVGRALEISREFFPKSSSVTGSGSAVFSLVPHGQQASVRGYCKAMEAAGVNVYSTELLV
jgi:4-diphosphocytidyl-2-C-methyl-D-erythritol kinase